MVRSDARDGRIDDVAQRCKVGRLELHAHVNLWRVVDDAADGLFHVQLCIGEQYTVQTVDVPQHGPV